MWKTRLTNAFPCRLPIMGAPMAGVSGGLLAAETCRAGGLGFIAAGHLMKQSYYDTLEKEIAVFRQNAPAGPLSIGFIGFSSFGENGEAEEGWKRFQHVLETHKPAVVQFFAPAVSIHPKTLKSNVQVAQEYGAKVLSQVGSVSEAKQALEAGVDGIIAQGNEGGGHGLRRDLGNGTLPLAARLVKLAAESTTATASKASDPNDEKGNNKRAKISKDVIVLAAGGIMDGRGLAAALALGCDGAVLGTRLWATKEAMGQTSFKERLVEAQSCDDVVRTTVFDQINNSHSSHPWPKPFDSLGALRNETSDKWDNDYDIEKNGKKASTTEDLARELKDSSNSTVLSDYKQADAKGDWKIASVLAGQGVGEIHSIPSAYDIIKETNEECQSILKNLSQLNVPEEK